jgi:hypothetical protein
MLSTDNIIMSKDICTYMAVGKFIIHKDYGVSTKIKNRVITNTLGLPHSPSIQYKFSTICYELFCFCSNFCAKVCTQSKDFHNKCGTFRQDCLFGIFSV